MLEIIFGVPLHAQRILRAEHADGFDGAIDGAGFDREAGGEAVDPLIMERIHREMIAPQPVREGAAGGERDMMGFADAHGGVFLHRRGMIEPVG